MSKINPLQHRNTSAEELLLASILQMVQQGGLTLPAVLKQLRGKDPKVGKEMLRRALVDGMIDLDRNTKGLEITSYGRKMDKILSN